MPKSSIKLDQCGTELRHVSGKTKWAWERSAWTSITPSVLTAHPCASAEHSIGGASSF